MKTTIQHIAALIAILTTAAFGQGGLTPPGAPAPTMKTLLEIWNKIVSLEAQADDLQSSITALKGDARTPITAIPITITQPGSYYLTGNFSVASGNAILISTDDVTLDLNGFTLSSTHASGSGSGISSNGARRYVEIKNGNIKGATTQSAGVFTPGGFLNGISMNAINSGNISVTGVRVHDVAVDGISIGSGSNSGAIIERCQASVCGGSGLRAGIVRHSTSIDAGNTGISAAIVTDSFANCLGLLNTYHGISGTEVANSQGISIGGAGIFAQNITNSTGTSTSGTGITGDSITNSRGVSSSNVGIFANHSVTSSYGQSATGSFGIDCGGTVSFSRATRSGGIAIEAVIAIGCTSTVGGGSISAGSKHLGTP